MTDKFGAFDIRNMNSAYALLHKLKEDGVTDIDHAMLKIQQYMEERAYQRKMKENKTKYAKQRTRIPTHKCKECGTPVYFYPVNTGAGDQTGDDSKAVFICYDKTCQHHEYTTMKPEKIPMKWVFAKYDRKTGVRFFNAS